MQSYAWEHYERFQQLFYINQCLSDYIFTIDFGFELICGSNTSFAYTTVQHTLAHILFLPTVFNNLNFSLGILI